MSDFAAEQTIGQRQSSNPSIEIVIAQRVAELLAAGNEDIYRIVIEPIEREVVKTVVAHCDGNYLRSSRILGISRMTLRKKIGVKRHFGGAARDEADYGVPSLP